MFQTKVAEKNIIHSVFSKSPLPQNRAAFEKMWENICFTARQAADGNMVHEHCMLDN